MVCIGKSNRLEKFDLEARCELLAAPQSGDCNEVNKIMARGKILKKKKKRHPTVPTIRWNGQKYFKCVLQYNVFSSKGKKISCFEAIYKHI